MLKELALSFVNVELQDVKNIKKPAVKVKSFNSIFLVLINAQTP